ncbi:uncharacterized protein LOC126829643 isoform X2 [Patella vulgata]|nr:uncharacterized protein LOC126829643 isoform X2 [Patella vulgata]
MNYINSISVLTKFSHSTPHGPVAAEKNIEVMDNDDSHVDASSTRWTYIDKPGEKTQNVVHILELPIDHGKKDPYTSSNSLTISWTKQAILDLISLHQEHDDFFHSSEYKKKSVWEMIARRLRELGYSYSWVQVENKWKSLTKTYRDVVNYNHKNAQMIPRTCPFYKELSEAYEYTPATSTNISSASNAVTPTIIQIKTIKRDANFLSDCDKCEPDRKKKYINNQAKTDLQELSSIIKSFNEERKRQDKAKLDRLEKMHREKMDMFSSFLKVFQDSLKK